MAETSAIEWCDSTFNPWMGCTRVSPACDDCYAARSTPARTLGVTWGPGAPRHRTSAGNWKQPERWQREAADFRAAHGRRRRVFCASLADVFDNEVPPVWRADLFDLIKATPDLDWLLLTKRVGNAWKMMADACGVSQLSLPLPLHNVWLGATVVNQEEADRDVPKLLRVPAAVRFLSIEPMLGPIDLVHLDVSVPAPPGMTAINRGVEMDALRGRSITDLGIEFQHKQRIDWVIAGGESGPKARPMHPDWVYSLRNQCAAAKVPFLFKQIGEWASSGDRAFGTVKGEVRHIDSAGQFLDPPPADENADCLTVVRVGKKAAGRLLAGRTHDEFPTP